MLNGSARLNCYWIEYLSTCCFRFCNFHLYKNNNVAKLLKNPCGLIRATNLGFLSTFKEEEEDRHCSLSLQGFKKRHTFMPQNFVSLIFLIFLNTRKRPKTAQKGKKLNDTKKQCPVLCTEVIYGKGNLKMEVGLFSFHLNIFFT